MISYKSNLRFVPVQWFYGPWTLKFDQIFSCHHFFSLCLEILTWFFGIWVYNDELQIKFTIRSGPMIFGQVMALGLWNLAKYLVVTTFFRYAWRYWLDFLVYEYIMMSYRSSLHFVLVQWFFGRVMALGLWNLAKYLVVTTLFHYDLRYWLDFWYESIFISYRSTLKFVLVEWFLADLLLLLLLQFFYSAKSKTILL